VSNLLASDVANFLKRGMLPQARRVNAAPDVSSRELFGASRVPDRGGKHPKLVRANAPRSLWTATRP